MQPGKPLIDWVWIVEHLDDIGERIVQHLQLTIIPLVLGFVISARSIAARSSNQSSAKPSTSTDVVGMSARLNSSTMCDCT